MNLRFYRTKDNLSTELELSIWRQIVVPVFCLAAIILLLSSWGERFSSSDYSSGAHFNHEPAELGKLQKKVAALEAESLRLTAFAQKMVSLAKLDKNVFSFDKPPAQGGLNGRNDGFFKRHDSVKQINSEVESLRQSMLRHSHHLERMQLILKSRVFGSAGDFAQWPVSKGYVSSPFGMRKDPFTGRYRKHRGLDIAGPTGTQVMTIAAGTVTFSGRKGGYGRMIEIRHDNNLISRYAHLSSTLVKKGQQVRRGELVGRIGSSGRSTGPHLHLEVLKNKKNVNPLMYLSGNPASQ